MSSTFDTVLVANRGEIAVRVLRGAREAGYRTVAVHSDADADAPHVHLADTAVRLGPAPASDSYLDIAAVLAAARATGAGAIHPGYGFLAENAEFAQACADAGVVFVGPNPHAIRVMGDKAAAKRLLVERGADVPLLAGYQGQDQSDARLGSEADAIGYPLMVKAAAGGGGKGMRLVTDPADLAAALQAARREATSAFGSDTLILERALLRPRHVEVQVLADHAGHTIALGERDCSVQRRHQKVVEEAPAPSLDPTTRSAMAQAAVAVARSVDYVGAGTVEFLLGEDGTFAFLEMNTRLQVEHPVTELVTGVDLVGWQLRIAAGQALTLTQDEVVTTGHAIEVRLYAEDPAQGFLPQTGTVLSWDPPTGTGVRTDAGVTAGSVVTAHYDPLLAKLIAHGADRDEARRRLVAALDELTCLGVRTNRAFLGWILRQPDFAAGAVTTAFLDEHPFTPPAPDASALAAIAGHLHLSRQAVAERRSAGLAGWTNAAWLASPMRLRVGDEVIDATAASREGIVEVSIDGVTSVVRAAPGGVSVDGRRVEMVVVDRQDGHLHVRLAGIDLDVIDILPLPHHASDAHGAGVLVAPMHGAVTATPAEIGQRVARGDAVIVIEAMKMEHVVRADTDGTVTEIAAIGAQVATGDVLAMVAPDDANDDASDA